MPYPPLSVAYKMSKAAISTAWLGISRQHGGHVVLQVVWLKEQQLLKVKAGKHTWWMQLPQACTSAQVIPPPAVALQFPTAETACFAL